MRICSGWCAARFRGERDRERDAGELRSDASLGIAVETGEGGSERRLVSLRISGRVIDQASLCKCCLGKAS